jgi:hypothetical protein
MNVTHPKNSLPKVCAFHRHKNTLTNKNFERIDGIPDFNGSLTQSVEEFFLNKQTAPSTPVRVTMSGPINKKILNRHYERSEVITLCRATNF